MAKTSKMVGRKVRSPENGGRRLVITDIHGCAITFKKLLEKVKLTKDDQLFLLGDFINRGPRSKEVIDHVLQLQEDGYNVFPLMGNHEETVLHILRERPEQLKLLLRSRNSLDLLNKNKRIRKRVFRFIRSLPYYYELDDFYLVHAGFNLNIDKPLTDTHAMAWMRNFNLAKKFNKRRVFFGHTPTKFSKIKEAVAAGAKSICLDNGCSHAYLGKEYGRLLCYDLDSGQLFKQRNID
ncbi:MAG: serine/threonine protein phosphatase [Flavobacteriales bacterium]|nr:serine/threonine protein phosphatase [Flavobacteriales bacterium]